MNDRLDRALGMDRDITRRDFLNGAGIALTGALGRPWFESARLPQTDVFAPEKAPDYYPPARTGLRGTHDGAWEVAHALRDGRTWDDVRDTGEQYDLVVVGGGISGLAAAYFFRQAAGPNARVLVLDNHDDFGGHAKRNEFTAGGRLWIGYGGTQAIEGRRSWSPVAKALRDELGIDTDKFFTAVDQRFYTSLGLGQGVYFDRETWGVDRLVKGGQGNGAEGPSPPAGWWREFAANAPFTDTARKDFIRIHEEKVDYLPDLSVEQKRVRLGKISYRDFLRDYAKVDPQVVQYFQQRTHSGWGVGIDAVPAASGA
jgi:spermidine dehydrogenase